MYVLLFYEITETLYKLHLSSSYYILIIHVIFQVKENSVFWQIRPAEFLNRSNLLVALNVLAQFDSDLPIQLVWDAFSLWGESSHILHYAHRRVKKPITFASRTLSKAESDYAELNGSITIIFRVCKFHWYLYGLKFHISDRSSSHIISFHHTWFSISSYQENAEVGSSVIFPHLLSSSEILH